MRRVHHRILEAILRCDICDVCSLMYDHLGFGICSLLTMFFLCTVFANHGSGYYSAMVMECVNFSHFRAPDKHGTAVTFSLLVNKFLSALVYME